MLFMVQRSIERAAEHEAKRTEQKARGELERQKLHKDKVSIACIVQRDITHGDTVTYYSPCRSLHTCTCRPLLSFHFVWHGSKAFVSNVQ